MGESKKTNSAPPPSKKWRDGSENSYFLEGVNLAENEIWDLGKFVKIRNLGSGKIRIFRISWGGGESGAE